MQRAGWQAILDELRALCRKQAKESLSQSRLDVRSIYVTYIDIEVTMHGTIARVEEASVKPAASRSPRCPSDLTAISLVIDTEGNIIDLHSMK